MNFTNQKRLNEVTKILPGCHAEPARDMAAAIKYCSKEETRIEGPWEYGTSPIERKQENFKITVAKAKTMTEEQL
jgi:hypothetical protein